MSLKVVVVTVLLVFAARAHAGGSAAYSTFTAPLDYGSVGSTHESTVKGHGGNSVVSHYSKAVDTPYSSVRKFDTRISNDAAVAYGGAYRYGAAPAVYGSYAAPAAYRTYAAPAAYSAYAAPAAYRAYAAPAAYRAYAAPAAAAYSAYAAPAAAAYRAYAAPAAYGYPAYPAVAKAAVAAPVGVAYSAAPAVAHLSFSGLGATYGW